MSPAWFASFEARLCRITVGDAASTSLRLGQVVTGTPAGTVSYTIHLGGGAPGSLEQGSVERAEVVLVEDYESARAIATGTPPATLLAQGRIKVRGNVNVLLSAAAELSALAEAFAEPSASR